MLNLLIENLEQKKMRPNYIYYVINENTKESDFITFQK